MPSKLSTRAGRPLRRICVRDGRTVERLVGSQGDRRDAAGAPGADDDPTAVGLEAQRVGRVGAQQAADLLGDVLEEVLLVGSAGHGRRDAAQRGLLLGQRAQGLLVALAAGGVADVAGELRRALDLRLRDRDLDGELAAVGAHRRQLDGMADELPLAGRDVLRDAVAMRLAQGGRDDQLGQLAPHHLVGRVAERPLRGPVDLDDVAVGVHGDDAVEGGVEHRRLAGVALAQAVLSPPALDALADAAAEARHRLEQVVVGLAALGGQELDGAEHVGRAADREAERRPQAGPGCARRTREVRVGAHVRDPRRLPARPHPARQPLAGSQRRAPAGLLERLAPLPGLDAAQRAWVVVRRGPERTELPPERLADRAQQPRIGGRLVARLDQDPRDGMLGVQEHCGIVMRRRVRAHGSEMSTATPSQIGCGEHRGRRSATLAGAGRPPAVAESPPALLAQLVEHFHGKGVRRLSASGAKSRIRSDLQGVLAHRGPLARRSFVVDFGLP